MLFSPTIGAAITAGYWFLRARCPACRTTGDHGRGRRFNYPALISKAYGPCGRAHVSPKKSLSASYQGHSRQK
jgi:hypothetical protein